MQDSDIIVSSRPDNEVGERIKPVKSRAFGVFVRLKSYTSPTNSGVNLTEICEIVHKSS